jgi:hypothetical protein
VPKTEENPFDRRNRPAWAVLRWVLVATSVFVAGFVILIWFAPSTSGMRTLVIDNDNLHVTFAMLGLFFYCIAVTVRVIVFCLERRKGRGLAVVLLLLHYALAATLFLSIEPLRKQRDLRQFQERQRILNLRSKDGPGR